MLTSIRLCSVPIKFELVDIDYRNTWTAASRLAQRNELKLLSETHPQTDLWLSSAVHSLVNSIFEHLDLLLFYLSQCLTVTLSESRYHRWQLYFPRQLRNSNPETWPPIIHPHPRHVNTLWITPSIHRYDTPPLTHMSRSNCIQLKLLASPEKQQ